MWFTDDRCHANRLGVGRQALGDGLPRGSVQGRLRYSPIT